MKRRCFDQRDPSFKYVGGRGLTMCERWLSFAAFMTDMGPKPGPGYSIDRRDNNCGYYLGNCRWATASQQQINSRKAVFLEHDGQRLCLSEWSRLTGIALRTISDRITRFGWTVADALTIAPVLGHHPVGDRRRIVAGKTVPLGINPSTGRLFGVCWNKRRAKWMSRIYLPTGVVYLGYYSTEHEATAAVQRKVCELRGEGLL